MNVFFLGTGAAEGIPALFCDCTICKSAKRTGGPDKRTRSTVLIDETIKIDLPPDTLYHVHQYPQINFARLQHLLFTHSHDDHFAVRELQYLSPNFAPHRKGPLHVWATSEVLKKMLPEMEHFFERAPLRFHSVLPYDTVAVDHLQVTPIVAHHRSDELCLNYLIHDTRPGQGKTLLYGTDTGWYDEATWEYMASCKVDAVILECGKGDSSSTYDGHLNVDEVFRFKNRLHDLGTIASGIPFYLTHIAHTGLLLHKPMQERVTGQGISVAYDGLQITV
jgi:phosphoribosyl 1,2-cyclic phosphate phosphodiesterase